LNNLNSVFSWSISARSSSIWSFSAPSTLVIWSLIPACTKF